MNQQAPCGIYTELMFKLSTQSILLGEDTAGYLLVSKTLNLTTHSV